MHIYVYTAHICTHIIHIYIYIWSRRNSSVTEYLRLKQVFFSISQDDLVLLRSAFHVRSKYFLSFRKLPFQTFVQNSFKCNCLTFVTLWQCIFMILPQCFVTYVMQDGRVPVFVRNPLNIIYILQQINCCSNRYWRAKKSGKKMYIGLEILCGIVITLIAFYCYLTINNNYWKNRGIPGPKPVPGFGNMKNVIFGKESVSQFLTRMYNEYKDEPMIGVFSKRTPVLIVKDVDLIKTILIKEFPKFANRGLFPIFSVSIFREYIEWKIILFS